MLGLIYKEFITNKKQFLMLSPGMLFFAVWMIIVPVVTPDLKDWECGLVFMLFSIIVFFMLELLEEGIFVSDEITKWQSFISSTEDGIKKQIGSKYIMNLFVTTVVYNFMIVIGSVSSAISGTDISVFLSLGFQLVWIQLFLRAVETPFIVAFGSKIGNYVRMTIIAIASLGFIIYGLFGDMSIFGSPAEFLLWLKDFVTDNDSYFLFLAPPATLVLLYISYLISCKVYLNGGRYYDR